jgi:hypothetical protein
MNCGIYFLFTWCLRWLITNNAGQLIFFLKLNAVGAEQMQMKLLSYFSLQISHFLHLTLLDQGYQGESMSALVGMRYIFILNFKEHYYRLVIAVF